MRKAVPILVLALVACSREEPLLFDRQYATPCEAFDDISHYALNIHVSRTADEYDSLRLESSKKLAQDIRFKGKTNIANCKDIEAYAKQQPKKTKMEVYSDALLYFMQEMDPHSLYIRQSRTEDFRKKDKNISFSAGFEPKYIHRAIKYAMPIDRILLDYVYPDTPAFKVLKAGDEIEQINGEEIAGKSFDEVNQLIDEHKNDLEIKVKRLEEPHYFKQIQFQKPALYSKVIEHNGYKFDFVRIPRFVDQVAQELEKKIIELNGKSSEGMILDLRGNPGGFVTEGVGVLRLFIKRKGEVFHTEGSGKGGLAGEYQYQAYGVDGHALYTKPLVVLVDSDTASIAEAVAGGLKYNNRAIIMGNNTFGKGTVQVDQLVSPKNGFGGMLVTTISLLYYPNEDTHQIKGLDPTYALEDQKFAEALEKIKNEDKLSIFFEKDYPNTIKPHGMNKDGLISDNGDSALNIGDVTNSLSKTCDDVAYQQCLETYAVKFLEILNTKSPTS